MPGEEERKRKRELNLGPGEGQAESQVQGIGKQGKGYAVQKDTVEGLLNQEEKP